MSGRDGHPAASVQVDAMASTVKGPFAPFLFGPTIRSRGLTSTASPFVFSPPWSRKALISKSRLLLIRLRSR